tara:strand:+ start:6341 stop:6604 length:264 start_codon:yes stop_codon:yes gene_type:complete
MLKKIENIFYLVVFFTLFFATINFYFSEKNIKKTNKSRSYYAVTSKNKIDELPLLKNDTNGIIEYKDDVKTYIKKKKKYSFWDLIGK